MPLLPLALLFACTPSETGGEETGKTNDPADQDGDGFPANVDCDDGDAQVHPEQDDTCDGVDSNCDGAVDEDADLVWYPDADGDGWGDANAAAVTACEAPKDHTSNHRDCDDTNADVWPGQAEACDSIDNNCDGQVDEGLGDPITVWPDDDGDGAGDANSAAVTGCEGVVEGVTNDYDCDDGDPREPVFATPSGARGDGSVDSPFGTLQEAIDAAYTCVRAYPGTYNEDIKTAGRDVDIASLSGSASTTLQGTGRGSAIYIGSGESVRFAGFTVTGGSGESSTTSYSNGDGTYTYYYQTRGGGAYVYASVATFEDVDFTKNVVYSYTYTTDGYGNTYYYTGFGGGIYAYASTVTLTRSIIELGEAYLAGAIYADYADIDLQNVQVLGNTADYYAAILSNSATATLTNVLADGNDDSGYYGFFTCNSCNATITNATLADNPTQVYAGYQAKITLQNSALQGGTYGVYEDSATSVTVRYTNVYNHSGGNYYGITDPTGTSGNTSVSSAFVDFNNDGDAFNDDLHLGSSSPLIDAGDPAPVFNDADGSPNDPGAYGGPDGDSW